jgi:hypothetical protein
MAQIKKSLFASFSSEKEVLASLPRSLCQKGSHGSAFDRAGFA